MKFDIKIYLRSLANSHHSYFSISYNQQQQCV